MRKLLQTTAIAIALAAPANADVIVTAKGGSTGDLVNFDSFTAGSNLAVGSFNGQHTGFVDFTCLTGCSGFTGAKDGNDIKIFDFSSLQVQVFAADKTTVLPTATDIFSIIGDGNPIVVATADEPGGGTLSFTFDLVALFGALGPGQNFFTLTATNGETIDKFTLTDNTGTITDFEHYRVDIATPAAVPAPLAGAGIPGLITACFGLLALNRRRRNRT